MVREIRHVYYINTDERTERRAHMEALLGKLGVLYTRIRGTKPDDPKGFYNRPVRGCWLAHELIMQLMLACPPPSLVLEDDVEIYDWAQCLEFYRKVQELPAWDVLYFYGSKTGGLERLNVTYATHAYIINEKSLPVIYERVVKQRELIEKTQPRNTATGIDQLFAHVLQAEMLFYGAPDLICQNITKFSGFTGTGVGERKWDPTM